MSTVIHFKHRQIKNKQLIIKSNIKIIQIPDLITYPKSIIANVTNTILSNYKLITTQHEKNIIHYDIILIVLN